MPSPSRSLCLRVALLLLTAGGAAVLVARPARAGDPPAAEKGGGPQGESASEQAFRDAWWAETGGGDLARALELYAQAAEADGPAAVRARALYRRAVVLQRIGKTPEAIAALERLARDFAAESALNADARARLAEWTAVDLRTSFGDWYKRYQYSPEFQAKVVDLVLALGSGDTWKQASAATELLTIGEAALPALQAHADTKNADLRDQVLPLLLKLGGVPQADSLRASVRWRFVDGAFAALCRAPAEARAKLRAALTEDTLFDQGLRASLDGPRALLAWAEALPAATAKRGEDDWILVCLGVLRTEQPVPEVAAAAQRILRAGKAPAVVRRFLLDLLSYWSLLKTADLVALLAEADRPLSLRALELLAFEGDDPPAALEALLSYEERLNDTARRDLSKPLSDALFKAVNWASWSPPDAWLDRVASALLRVGLNSGLMQLGPRSYEVLARLVDRAPDAARAEEAARIWNQRGRPDVAALEQAKAWLVGHPHAAVRRRVVKYMQDHVAAIADEVLRLFAAPGLAADARMDLGQALLHRTPQVILQGPEQRRMLLDGLLLVEREAAPGVGLSRDQQFLVVASAAASVRDGARLLCEEWLSAPDQFPEALVQMPMVYTPTVGQADVVVAWHAVLGAVLERFPEAWPRWTWPQRRAALRVARVTSGAAQDLLRQALRDPASGATAEDRRALLVRLEGITLEDARAAWDLRDPAQASQFFSACRAEITPTAAWLDALAATLEPASPAAFDVGTFFLEAPELQARVCRLLLAHRGSAERELALRTLRQRAAAADLPLWLLALKDPDPALRASAAGGLGELGSREAAQALLQALDDPSAAVRDAAQTALEAFEKLEATKRRWAERLR